VIDHIKKKLFEFIAIRLNIPTNKKQEMLKIAFPAVKSWGIEGNYFEFGVYEGRTFIEAYKQSSRLNIDMSFFAFDSFKGLPSPSLIEGECKFRKGQYTCSKQKFLVNLKKAGVDLNRVTCVEGFFSDSLTGALQERFIPMKAAIVWIDCDLYESTKAVLEFLPPFLQTGCIVCFDDWFSFGGHPMKGEIHATREWLERNPSISLTEYRDFGVSGRSFIVQKGEE
jgi:hypothetical protein